MPFTTRERPASCCPLPPAHPKLLVPVSTFPKFKLKICFDKQKPVDFKAITQWKTDISQFHELKVAQHFLLFNDWIYNFTHKLQNKFKFIYYYF